MARTAKIAITKMRPVAAIQFGSTLPKRAAGINRRSDVEFVVICRDDCYAEMVETSKRMIAQAAGNHVPLNIYIVPFSLARGHYHTIGYGLCQHLRRAEQADGLLKHIQSPLRYLNLTGTTARADLGNYLVHKLHIFGSRLLKPRVGADRLEWLQKIVEGPVHLTRKVLEYQGVEMPDDSRQFVIELAKQHRGCDIAQELSQAVAVDRRYNALLEAWYAASTMPLSDDDPARSRAPTEDEYAAMLNRIEDLALPVYQMFAKVAGWLDHHKT
ncbi:MAG: hypothetical protein WC773_01890 [Patescibacteria group bacterium]